MTFWSEVNQKAEGIGSECGSQIYMEHEGSFIKCSTLHTTSEVFSEVVGMSLKHCHIHVRGNGESALLQMLLHLLRPSKLLIKTDPLTVFYNKGTVLLCKALVGPKNLRNSRNWQAGSNRQLACRLYSCNSLTRPTSLTFYFMSLEGRSLHSLLWVDLFILSRS